VFALRVGVLGAIWVAVVAGIWHFLDPWLEHDLAIIAGMMAAMYVAGRVVRPLRQRWYL